MIKLHYFSDVSGHLSRCYGLFQLCPTCNFSLKLDPEPSTSTMDLFLQLWIFSSSEKVYFPFMYNPIFWYTFLHHMNWSYTFFKFSFTVLYSTFGIYKHPVSCGSNSSRFHTTPENVRQLRNNSLLGIQVGSTLWFQYLFFFRISQLS